MDCREAEILIQTELDRALMGDDDRFGATEGPSRMTLLEEHTDRCPRCAALRLEYAAIDAALRSAPVDRAPVWLAAAIMSEIAETSTARRFARPVGLSATVAAGLAGAVLVLVRSGTGQAAGRALGALSSAISSLLGSVLDVIAGSPGLQAAQGSDMAFGVLWGLVTVSVVFIAISGFRMARELTSELQPVFPR